MSPVPEIRKSVLFLIDSLDCGGAEKSLLSLLPLLDFSRFDICLSIIRRGGVFESYLPPQVRQIKFPKPSLLLDTLSDGLFSFLSRVFKLLGINRHGAELRWICKRAIIPAFKEHFDIAVAYQQGFPTYYVANKIPAPHKYAWINADLKNAGYRPGFNRAYYDRFSQICVVSNALFRLIPACGYARKEKLIVIKDIINVDLIRKMALAQPPAGFTDNPNRIRILTVGRMAPPKNYPLAVETAHLLSKRGVRFIWYFVGDGLSRREIEREIHLLGLQDRIMLLGFQANPYPYFQNCDIYVQTSSFEGFGLTLSEAKVFHKPIVTTNFPSAYDQIQDGVDGLIAKMEPNSLADRIMAIINDPSLKERLIGNTTLEVNCTAETERLKVNHLLMKD